MTDAVVYRPCSVCAVTMNRRNFAQISGVIVDECREHGTFFDAGELEHVVAFVRSGGMLLARERKQEELERQRRRDELGTISQTRSPLMGDADAMPGADWLEPDLGLAFVRWAGRWVRNMFR